jgi:hypothetical protein
MKWHWLFEILERELSPERIVLANPFKTRIIAEAQIKTDKVERGFWLICCAAGSLKKRNAIGPSSLK